MKREEQQVHLKGKTTGKVQKQLKNISDAERRTTELTGNEASVAAELNNRKNKSEHL